MLVKAESEKNEKLIAIQREKDEAMAQIDIERKEIIDKAKNDADLILDDYLKKGDEYLESKKKEANEYYDSKKDEADALIAMTEHDNGERTAAIKKKEEEIDKRKKEAEVSIVKAKNDADEFLKDSINKADKYLESKKKEADEYYDNKKDEADVLMAKAESSKNDKIAEIKQMEKESTEKIDEARKKADEIIKRAEENADEEMKIIVERQNKINSNEEEITKKLADLKTKEINYKKEILDSVQNQLDSISIEKENIETQLQQLEKELKEKEKDIAALEDDRKYYEEELKNNSVKHSEIIGYKTKIEQLENNLNTINALYKKLQEENNNMRSQIIIYGDDPSKAIQENSRLKKRISELESLLANCPNQEELDNLRSNSIKYEEINNKLERVTQDKLRLEEENNELKVNEDEIESYRKFIKILELQKSELQRELDRNIELYSNRTEKVFANLSLIDSEPVNYYPSILRSSNINLKVLCDRFRRYLANRKENALYYEEKTIRTFVAGFASSRLMILEGLSGTGKSSLPRAFADFIGSKTIEVPVQSSWKDRNDLLGFYNDFKKQYKETEFLKALYRATHDPNNIYIIVLDEMNLSRIEYYFADLLSILEKPKVEDWKIELISDFASINGDKNAWPKLIDQGKLQINDNTWFIGTANKDDSTFIITDKVYDRSVVLNFDKKGEYEKSNYSEPIKMNNDDFQNLLLQASKFSDDKLKSRFDDIVKYLDEKIKEYFQITFGNRVANQLEKFVPAYVACGGSVDEAIDVMFSRKILRKLEGLYDENTRQCLEVFKDDIEQKQYEMPITIKNIEKMIEKI